MYRDDNNTEGLQTEKGVLVVVWLFESRDGRHFGFTT
jgi:hypothetical protein